MCPRYYFWNELTGQVQWQDPGNVAYQNAVGRKYWLGEAGQQLDEDPSVRRKL